MKSSEPDDVVVMLVLFRREDKSSPIEVNLRAPLLINARTRRGTQKTIEPRMNNLALSGLAQTVN